MATAPARNQGAKKPTLQSPLPDQEVLAHGIVEGPVCRKKLIIDPGSAGLGLERGYVGVDLSAVFFLGVFGGNFDGVLGFHVDQQRRLFQLGTNLLWI